MRISRQAFAAALAAAVPVAANAETPVEKFSYSPVASIPAAANPQHFTLLNDGTIAYTTQDFPLTNKVVVHNIAPNGRETAKTVTLNVPANSSPFFQYTDILKDGTLVVKDCGFKEMDRVLIAGPEQTVAWPYYATPNETSSSFACTFNNNDVAYGPGANAISIVTTENFDASPNTSDNAPTGILKMTHGVNGWSAEKIFHHEFLGGANPYFKLYANKNSDPTRIYGDGYFASQTTGIYDQVIFTPTSYLDYASSWAGIASEYESGKTPVSLPSPTGFVAENGQQLAFFTRPAQYDSTKQPSGLFTVGDNKRTELCPIDIIANGAQGSGSLDVLVADPRQPLTFDYAVIGSQTTGYSAQQKLYVGAHNGNTCENLIAGFVPPSTADDAQSVVTAQFAKGLPGEILVASAGAKTVKVGLVRLGPPSRPLPPVATPCGAGAVAVPAKIN
jgi:hypothetical protein